jgi:hypothetical protein
MVFVWTKKEGWSARDRTGRAGRQGRAGADEDRISFKKGRLGGAAAAIAVAVAVAVAGSVKKRKLERTKVEGGNLPHK